MALGLTGCLFSDDNDEGWPPIPTVRLSFGMDNTKAIASDSNIPLPNDLYFLDADGIRQKNLVIMGCGLTDRGVETGVENATKCSLEALDGWSTTAPFSLPLSGNPELLDSGSFPEGIRLFSPNKVLVYGEDFTVQVAKFGHLQILPLKVLSPETTYTLVVTRQLTDKSGIAVAHPDAYLRVRRELTAAGEHIRNVERQVVNEKGIAGSDIVYAAQFTTQSIGGELLTLAQNAEKLAITFDSSKAQKYAVNGLFPGCKENTECVEKVSGKIQLPNYLASNVEIAKKCTADTQSESEAKFWYQLYGANAHFESFQYTKDSCPGLYQPMNFDDTSTSEIEVSMVLPSNKGSDPLSLDVVIAAHGITATKELGNGGMLIFDNFVQPTIASRATSVAGNGYGVVAIDHVYHGARSISLNSNAGYDCSGDDVADSGCFESSSNARVLKADYDISASASVRGLFPGYGAADAKNFLKSDALLTSRDNFRKVVADLLNLKAALANAQDTSGAVSFNSDNVSIYGHSMGAIAAVTASGIEQINGRPFTGSILANFGGGIGGIIMNSPWLGKDEVPPALKLLPEFRLRMAKELGIEAESQQATLDAVRQFAETNKEAFLAKVAEVEPAFLAEGQYLIQAVVDTVDPLNYAAQLQDRPMLSMTAVGNKAQQVELVDYQGRGFTAADQTVPIQIELGDSTLFTRCRPNEQGEVVSVSPNLTCETGTEAVPYYSLDTTEFPLAGARSLESVLGLVDVREGTTRSAARLVKGNHNIGVGAMVDKEAEGTREQRHIKEATSEIVAETVSFLSDEFGVVNKVDESLLSDE